MYDRVSKPQKKDNSSSNQSKQVPLQRSTHPGHINNKPIQCIVTLPGYAQAATAWPQTNTKVQTFLGNLNAIPPPSLTAIENNSDLKKALTFKETKVTTTIEGEAFEPEQWNVDNPSQIIIGPGNTHGVDLLKYRFNGSRIQNTKAGEVKTARNQGAFYTQLSSALKRGSNSTTIHIYKEGPITIDYYTVRNGGNITYVIWRTQAEAQADSHRRNNCTVNIYNKDSRIQVATVYVSWS